MAEEIKQDFPAVSLVEPGIVEMDYGYQGSVSLEAIKSGYHKHIALNLEGKQAILVTADSLVGADYEAQRFASNPQVCAITLASAIVVKSFLERHIGNMFMRYQHPPYPSRLFSSRSKAIVWLREQLSEYTQSV